MAPSYRSKWPAYAKQWDALVIKPGRRKQFQNYALKLLHNKEHYLVVQGRTGVPWYLIGLLHLRESDADFSTYLGNGDPLRRKTTHVPRGRGPFKTFADGAADALRYDGLTRVKDWRLEKVLYYAERFNGFGYSNKGLPSPYVWGGTNIQKRGKFIADRKWSPTAWDTQPGIAPILVLMMKEDKTIAPPRET